MVLVARNTADIADLVFTFLIRSSADKAPNHAGRIILFVSRGWPYDF
jgi:hypothetical protein